MHVMKKGIKGHKRKKKNLLKMRRVLLNRSLEGGGSGMTAVCGPQWPWGRGDPGVAGADPTRVFLPRAGLGVSGKPCEGQEPGGRPACRHIPSGSGPAAAEPPQRSGCRDALLPAALQGADRGLTAQAPDPAPGGQLISTTAPAALRGAQQGWGAFPWQRTTAQSRPSLLRGPTGIPPAPVLPGAGDRGPVLRSPGEQVALCVGHPPPL